MNERPYTVSELDALRYAVEQRWLFGTSILHPEGGISRSFLQGEKDKAVEELVRTHMLAGHTAQDIYDADRPKPPLEVTEADREQGATDMERAYPRRRFP